MLMATSVWSHGGGLDRYGCHNETKTGVRHLELIFFPMR